MGERALRLDRLGDQNGPAALAALARKVESVYEGLTSERTGRIWSGCLQNPPRLERSLGDAKLQPG